MIITIDTTKDTIDVSDIYMDSDMEMLTRIRDARNNVVTNSDAYEQGRNNLLKKVLKYLKDENMSVHNDSTFPCTPLIQQIKMVRSVTNMNLKEAKHFVENAWE